MWRYLFICVFYFHLCIYVYLVFSFFQWDCSMLVSTFLLNFHIFLLTWIQVSYILDVGLLLALCDLTLPVGGFSFHYPSGAFG